MDISGLQKVLLDVKKNILSPEKVDALCAEIALSLYASNQKRIITDGLDINEKPIGKYSEKPIYINPARSPIKFSPLTKVKKNPKTRFFKGGYKEFRGFVGRPNDKVNVDLSHKLKNDYKIYHTGPAHYQIGFASEYGKEVSEGNEKHFGCKIWGIAVSDKALISKIIKGYLNRHA